MMVYLLVGFRREARSPAGILCALIAPVFWATVIAIFSTAVGVEKGLPISEFRWNDGDHVHFTCGQ